MSLGVNFAVVRPFVQAQDDRTQRHLVVRPVERKTRWRLGYLCLDSLPI